MKVQHKDILTEPGHLKLGSKVSSYLAQSASLEWGWGSAGNGSLGSRTTTPMHPTAARRPGAAAGKSEVGAGASQDPAAGIADTSVSGHLACNQESPVGPRAQSSRSQWAEGIMACLSLPPCQQGSPGPAAAGSPRGSKNSWAATSCPSRGEALPAL